MKFTILLSFIVCTFTLSAQRAFDYHTSESLDSVDVRIVIFDDNQSLVYRNTTDIELVSIHYDDIWEENGYIVIVGHGGLTTKKYRITLSDIAFEMYDFRTGKTKRFFK